jgi:hypothetical protein
MTPDEANQYFFSSTGNVKAQPKNYKELLGRLSIFGKTFDETMGSVNDSLAGTTNAKFLADYQANPGSYLQGRGADLLQKTYSRVMQYAEATKGDVNGVSSTFLQTAPHSKFSEYIDYVRNNELVTKSNTDVIHKNLRSSTSLTKINDKAKTMLINSALNTDLTLVDKETFLREAESIFKANPKISIFKNKEGSPGYLKLENLTDAAKRDLDKILAAANAANLKKGIKNGSWDTSKYNSLSAFEQEDIISKFQSSALETDESIAEEIYDDLSKIYSTTIQNTKEMKLSSNLLTKDKANAVYNTAENGITINLAAVQSAGFRGFLETLDDAGKINFYDMKNNPISFFGNSITGVKETQDLYSGTDDIYRHVKIAEMILNNYKNNIGKKDIKNFTLTSSQIAIEDLNKGAMTLYPTLDVLKTLKAGEGAGLLDDTIINAIATNGISMISNRRNFNNWIFEGNQATPTESIINALGSISYTDPMGGGNFIIEKDESGVAPYKVYGTYLEMQADGSKKEVPFALPPVNYQNNVGLAQSTAKESLQRMADYNQLVWQQFQSKTYTPGISTESPESKRQFGKLR